MLLDSHYIPKMAPDQADSLGSIVQSLTHMQRAFRSSSFLSFSHCKLGVMFGCGEDQRGIAEADNHANPEYILVSSDEVSHIISEYCIHGFVPMSTNNMPGN